MGAIVGWLFYLKLNHYYKDKVKTFFISSALTPQEFQEKTNCLLNNNEIKDFTTNVHHFSKHFLSSCFYDTYFLPTLKNDLKLLHTIVHLPEMKEVIKVPVIAFVGNIDQVVSCAQLAAWKTYTESQFKVNIFNGDHFYLYDEANVTKICQIINKSIKMYF
jgi:surfactin synthase thioesterase subunit